MNSRRRGSPRAGPTIPRLRRPVPPRRAYPRHVHVAIRLFLALVLLLLPPACGSSGGRAPPPPAPFVPFEADSFQPATAVVGQDAFTSAAPNAGGRGAATLSSPTCALESGGRLWITDVANNRVLGYAGPPTGVGATAEVVLGQPDPASGTPGTSATLMREPVSLVVAGGRLYVSEFGNHRVLIYGAVPAVSGTAAVAALGQADLDTAAEGTNPSRLREPVGVHAGGGRFVLADAGNHRVLVWNSPPTISGQPADLVLGQATFFGGVVNAGGAPGAATMSSPFGVWTDGVRLAVADRGNNRVLLWTAFPTQNGQPADLVLGQPDFQSVDPSSGATGLRQPSDVTSNGVQLLVADGDNHRILLWDAFPSTMQAPADMVLGQSTFGNVAPNDDNQDLIPDATPSARTCNGLGGFLFARLTGPRLWVGDFRNNRVLRFDSR
jgi:hypothetical protein